MKVCRRTRCLSEASDMTVRSIIMSRNLFIIKDPDVISVVIKINSSSVTTQLSIRSLHDGLQNG